MASTDRRVERSAVHHLQAVAECLPSIPRATVALLMRSRRAASGPRYRQRTGSRYGRRRSLVAPSAVAPGVSRDHPFLTSILQPGRWPTVPPPSHHCVGRDRSGESFFAPPRCPHRTAKRCHRRSPAARSGAPPDGSSGCARNPSPGRSTSVHRGAIEATDSTHPLAPGLVSWSGVVIPGRRGNAGSPSEYH